MDDLATKGRDCAVDGETRIHLAWPRGKPQLERSDQVEEVADNKSAQAVGGDPLPSIVFGEKPKITFAECHMERIKRLI